MFTLEETETDTDKNGLHRFVWKCNTTQSQRQRPMQISIGFYTNVIAICFPCGLDVGQCRE